MASTDAGEPPVVGTGTRSKRRHQRRTKVATRRVGFRGICMPACNKEDTMARKFQTPHCTDTVVSPVASLCTVV